MQYLVIERSFKITSAQANIKQEVQGKKHIKIIHLVHTLAVGGLENGVINLINHLDPEQFKSSIYSLCEPDTLRERVNYKTRMVVLNKRPGNDLAAIIRLSKLFRMERPSIVHTHAWGTLVEGFLASKLARVPIFVHGEHGTMETRWWNILIQKFLLRFVDRIISVSENHRHIFAKKIGIPLNKIETIQNGVDLEQFRPIEDPKKLKKSFRIPENHVVIGSVGRLVEVKQYDVFLKVLSSIMKKEAFISAVLIGDGPLREDLEHLAEELKIRNRVHFLGQLNDISKAINLMDIFILTSKSEGLSNTILEAMASGLPVVATDVGGTNEIVVHGETGLLVPSQDFLKTEKALLGLIQNDKKRQLMGKLGRKRVETHFEIMNMVHAYQNFYLNLLKKKQFNSQDETFLYAYNF